MENKALMQKLYDIARATRTTNEYISYIGGYKDAV